MTRILVVDDDPMVREVLQGLLEEKDREVLTSAGAAEALGHARAAEIAVALVDKNLGPDDGLDLSRRLKEVQPEMEIILITGYASIDSAIEAVQIGAFDYLTKPIADFGSLGVKVQSAIGKSALRRSQRALLERLMESEVRHRRLIDAAPEAVVMYDAITGRIVEANEAAIELYGYEPSELMLLRASDLRGEATDVASGPHPAVQRHRRKDGGEFTAEVTFTHFTQQGRLLKVQSARDVGERLRAEEERRALQERLHLAEKMKAIGRFADGLARELGAVCGEVQAHAEALVGRLDGNEARAALEGIRHAAARGAALNRQLALFGRQPGRPEQAVDLGRLVAEVGETLARVPMENVELRASLPQRQLTVRGSAELLTEAILHLANNARQAMPRGGTLSLELDEEHFAQPRSVRGVMLPAGRYAHLRVRDTGGGIGDAIRQRLFEPFFTTRQGNGKGLGLATAYGIVASAEGGIEVESAEGRGATFHVWLPVAG